MKFLGLSSHTESSAGSHVVVTNKVTVHQYIVQIIVQKLLPPDSHRGPNKKILTNGYLKRDELLVEL